MQESWSYQQKNLQNFYNNIIEEVIGLKKQLFNRRCHSEHDIIASEIYRKKDFDNICNNKLLS